MHLVGGEWAGWLCHFSPSTGALQPVPDSMLSATAIEWGQVPLGFEALSSEELVSDAESTGRLVHRQAVKVLPEDGCLVEDLPAQINRSTLPVRLPRVGEPVILTLDTRLDDERWRVETVVAGAGVLPRERRNALAYDAERLRVAFTFHPRAENLAVSSSVIEVWQERRWAGLPQLQLHGQAGGRSGLDTAWVAQAVGTACFGESLPALNADRDPANDALLLPCGVELRRGPRRLEIVLRIRVHGTSPESTTDTQAPTSSFTLRRQYGEEADDVELTLLH